MATGTLVPLRRIAHCRSGDKGDTSNMAAFAYEPALYPLLLEQLTAERVRTHYGGLIRGHVIRYEVANLHALNFVCQGALGGGVSRSLYIDNYGKALSAALLAFQISVPDELLPLVRREDGR